MNQQDSTVQVVGIGASAGGMDALKEFFSEMPIAGLAFVVVQHLDPNHMSYMASLLAKCTQMKVTQAENRMPVEANCVYTIPRGKFLLIKDGMLHLTEPVKRDGIRMPIDFFFRSLAQDQHENAIAILFSGSGSDGTLGIREIHGAGGIVMVQDPKAAQFDSMIESAIATGMADYVLPVRDIPGALLQYVQQSSLKFTGTDTEDQLGSILHLLASQTKNDFRFYKNTTLQRRVTRRMGLNRISQFSDYYRFLQENPDEMERLSKDMLIGVTSFFRDPEAFAELREKVIKPLVQEKNKDDPLRVWIAGCATGEEAYSVAMLLREEMARTRKSCGIQLFASDIDHQALKYAREATYPESIAADVSEKRLAQFFTKKDRVYQINKEIREGITFAAHNMIMDPPFMKMDLISCRNLLIYIKPEMQKKLLSLFAFALKPDGYLFLGKSDTTGEQSDSFEPISRSFRIFRRKPSQRAEELLRESAGRLQAVVDTAVDAIITIAEDGMIGTFNGAAERIFGYKSAEVMGRDVNLLMPEPYHSEHNSYLSNYLRTGKRKIIGIGREVQGLRKDGTIFPLELAVSETKLPDRRIFTAIIRDITNRKRAETRLAAEYGVTRVLAESRTLAEASEKILQMIGETLGWEFGALWTVDRDAKARCMKTWHLASKHFPEFDAISHQLTFSPGIGLVGRIWASKEPVCVPDVVNDNNFPRAPIAAKENLHGAFGFPIRMGHEVSGVMEFYSHGIRQPDEALLKMVGAIGSEIGQFIERLRAEEELRNLNEELENRVAKRTADLQQANAALLRDIEEREKLEKRLRENERLASLGLVTAKVTHEIANPLNSIYTTTQLLEKHFKAHQESVDKLVIEMASELRSEIERLKSLLEEIRSFSNPNLQRLELEPANLSVLAVEVLTREMTNYIERGIRIEHDLPAELPPVMIDRKKMVQVLFNLYKNAVEAMPEGGTLTVRGYRSGEYVCLEIADTGVGIPKDLDVFEPFSTTKPTGMGIGLVVVRQIVSAHGGSITYTSEASKGTVFRIGLPLRQ